MKQVSPIGELRRETVAEVCGHRWGVAETPTEMQAVAYQRAVQEVSDYFEHIGSYNPDEKSRAALIRMADLMEAAADGEPVYCDYPELSRMAMRAYADTMHRAARSGDYAANEFDR